MGHKPESFFLFNKNIHVLELLQKLKLKDRETTCFVCETLDIAKNYSTKYFKNHLRTNIKSHLGRGGTYYEYFFTLIKAF